MTILRMGLLAALMSGLAWVPTARADDDWEDYREELRERREEARERARERWEDEREWRKEARERARERWEDEREWLEDRYDDGVVVRGPRWQAPPRYYYRERGPVTRYRTYYRRPYVDRYYNDYDGPIVERYRYRYPQARYYGTPGFGYVEGPYGQREVRVGPFRAYWNR